MTAACWDTVISYPGIAKIVHPVRTTAIEYVIDYPLDDSVSNGSQYCGAMTYVDVDLTSPDFTAPDVIVSFD